MASLNETTATTAGTNSKTGFFDLPRELRDEIYDLALEHERPIAQDSGTMHLHVRAPEPHLRLVSRQFASEYYERSPFEKDICLSVNGSSPTIRPQNAGGFTYAARASTVNVTLTFDPFDDSLWSYVDYLASWLSKLIENMPCIGTLHITLCFNIPPSLKTFDWFSRAAHRASPYVAIQFRQLQKGMEPIISLDKLDFMVVLPKLDTNNADCTRTELGKIGFWTPAGGYEADVGLAELRRKYSGS